MSQFLQCRQDRHRIEKKSLPRNEQTHSSEQLTLKRVPVPHGSWFYSDMETVEVHAVDGFVMSTWSEKLTQVALSSAEAEVYAIRRAAKGPSVSQRLEDVGTKVRDGYGVEV